MFDENINFDDYIEKFIIKRLENWSEALPALLASLRDSGALSADAVNNLETFFNNNRDVVMWYHVTGLLQAFNYQLNIDVTSLQKEKRLLHEEYLLKMQQDIERYSYVLATSNQPQINFPSTLEH